MVFQLKPYRFLMKIFLAKKHNPSQQPTIKGKVNQLQKPINNKLQKPNKKATEPN